MGDGVRRKVGRREVVGISRFSAVRSENKGAYDAVVSNAEVCVRLATYRSPVLSASC